MTAADQSRSLAPRDGLAGSDEAVVLAPNRVRPSQVIIVGARMTADVLDLVRDVEDGFAEAVRAEAVAEHRADLQHRIEVSTRYESDRRVALAERDEYHRHWQDAEKRAATAVAEAVAEERQRIIEWVGDMCTYRERDGRALAHPHPADHLGPCPYGEVVQHILAAGSVPVATPAAEDVEPVPISPEFRQRPVAATERPLRVRRAVLLLAGHASGHLPGAEHACRTCHAHWPCEAVHRAAQPALEAFADCDASRAEPSVGTGTPAEAGWDGPAILGPGTVVRRKSPAEEVSGGSGHTERQASDDELRRLQTFTAAVDQMLGDMDAAELRAEVHRLTTTREQWLRQAATVWEPARFALLVNERDEAVAEVARLERERDNACAAIRRRDERISREVAEVARLTGALAVSEAERVEVFTEAASYRAAIEGVQEVLTLVTSTQTRHDPPSVRRLIEAVVRDVRAALAAALGDGAR